MLTRDQILFIYGFIFFYNLVLIYSKKETDSIKNDSISS
jgi:hypothetical protein